MCSISREQAICIFYCKEFNEENVRSLLKKINKLEELELCYDDDPKYPLLVTRVRINAEHSKYKKYEDSYVAKKKIT